MYMFGKVTPKQYDEIKAQGWEIIRRPSFKEVDLFCDPAYVGTSKRNQDEDDFFVLVWIDNDISNPLTTWFNQDKTSNQDKACREYQEAELEYNRKIFADGALATLVMTSDFHSSSLIPTSEEILDTGKWETDGPNRLICPIYYGGPGGDKKGSFIVEFKPNSTEIIDKHANL